MGLSAMSGMTTELATVTVAGIAVLGILTSFAVASPRRLLVKGAALVVGAVGFAGAVYALPNFLALPKPVGLEWWHANAEEATVLAASLQEDEAIYLWLLLRGVDEPRAYALPWSRDLAEQLQAAQREAEESQTKVQMRLPFEDSLDDREPKFYATPQLQLPAKDADQPPAMQYQRQDTHLDVPDRRQVADSGVGEVRIFDRADSPVPSDPVAIARIYDSLADQRF